MPEGGEQAQGPLQGQKWGGGSALKAGLGCAERGPQGLSLVC